MVAPDVVELVVVTILAVVALVEEEMAPVAVTVESGDRT